MDASVYVDEDYRAQGIGRALYTSLFACLRVLGLYNVYAGVTLPNDARVALHEVMGFAPVGVYRSVGYKLGRWHDVGWWHLRLLDEAAAPVMPRALAGGERLLSAS